MATDAAAGRRRRAPRAWAVAAPRALRAMVRAEEILLVLLAAGVGVLAGAGVCLINAATSWMHGHLFALPYGQGLSESARVSAARVVLVPVLGGVALGALAVALQRWHPRRPVDPVEANALFGGRMSLADSAIVAGQTAWSNGVGASVGMEAGYAQLGSGVASCIGQALRLRRGDLRLLVGCGAAAAIGGAFNAPLCGAFYGIELIIGTYALGTLPLVVIAALAGTLTVQLVLGPQMALDVTLPAHVPNGAYPAVLVLGALCGLAGIAIMRGVTAVEAMFRRSRIPLWLRPVLGGAVVAALGSVSPKALSSGHSALHADINVAYPFAVALLFLLLKAVASAFSIGSGFRGGLFFASLFLGMLFGKVFAGVAAVLPIVAMPTGFYAVVGMSGMATAIVGGPMTMTFLALESTANFSVTMAVLAASIVAAITVRRLFGYSFTTWRFHLRGEAIRSGVDIGWLQALTVGRMMRRAEATVHGGMSLAAFRQDYPLGAVQRVVVTDGEGRYAGLAFPAEAYGLNDDGGAVADILHHAGDVLLPGMSVKQALAAFESAEADALAVLETPESRRVLGVLTEQYALRRYNEALERRRRELAGE